MSKDNSITLGYASANPSAKEENSSLTIVAEHLLKQALDDCIVHGQSCGLFYKVGASGSALKLAEDVADYNGRRSELLTILKSYPEAKIQLKITPEGVKVSVIKE